MNYILNKQIKHYTKEIAKFVSLLVFGFLIITLIILIKYKPIYIVTLAGEELGKVTNKDQIEKSVSEYINTHEEGIAFITLEENPEYELKFVEKINETDEENVLIAIREASVVTYKMYAITLAGVQKSVVATMSEAEKVIEEIKQEFEQDIELDLNVTEVYDNNKITIETVEAAFAKVNEDNIIKEKLAEQAATVNGVLLKTPVSGIITSRFGGRSSGYHTGLDIATSTGTPIKVCSNGTVTYADWYGTYGKLVKVSHGNGVETWYAHCNEIYVTVGEEVSTGDVIAAVGSTGNSTGSHLHLEIRINGEQTNPQKYLYN